MPNKMHPLSYNLMWNTFYQLISFPQLLSDLSNPHLCGIIYLKYSTRFCNRNARIQSSSKHEPFSLQEKKKQKWGHSSTLITYSTAKDFPPSCGTLLFIQGRISQAWSELRTGKIMHVMGMVISKLVFLWNELWFSESAQSQTPQ